MFQMGAGEAIRSMNTWAGQPLPLSAACHLGDTLYVSPVRHRPGRARGAYQTRRRARHPGRRLLAGTAANTSYHSLPERRRSGRLSVPPAAALLNLPANWLLDWGGAQRWLRTNANEADIRRAAQAAGGHAIPFRNAVRPNPLFLSDPATSRLARDLQLAFDPSAIFNPTLSLD